MSETCIVCLGDLGENASALPVSGQQLVRDVDAKLSEQTSGTSIDPPPPPPQSPIPSLKSPASDTELIAHLLPCGHNLHDECLKPWVERANSCPICRQKFNQVELTKTIGGDVISSYPVQDRTQVADIDPSMLIEELEDQEFPPCKVCGNDDNEDVLLLCDGCSDPYHTYCVELRGVPVGSWYCEHCAYQRAIVASLDPAGQVNPATARRTRQELRRTRNSRLAHDSDWARVWETILDRTTIDLDFPHYSPEQVSTTQSSRNRTITRRAWERRLRVADEQGGARQLRNIAPLFDYDEAPASRPRPEPEEPESIEEIMAWNAMEKARDIEADPVSRSRKRRRTRSVTASPASPQPPPDPAPRKRPRTRRPNDVPEATSDGGESSNFRRMRPFNRSVHLNNSAGPSFLQSLLKEVESSAPVEDEPRGRPRLSIRPNLEHMSPQGSSPEASPTSSNAPSPRAGSTSPPPKTRPGSPELTSRIEPIYPHLGFGDMSPVSPVQPSPERPKLKPKSRVEIANRTRSWVEAVESSPTRVAELSPTRVSMSLSAKERIQKLVKEALKEPYHANRIDKDQYTDINRNVSRMLYDKVGEDGDVEGSQSDEWRRLANEEVSKAVVALQTKVE